MQNAAGAGHAEESFEVAAVIPHHGGDAVAGLQAEFDERGSEAAGAAIEIAVAGARDGTVWAARNDFDAGEDLVRALEERGEGQREIHHGAAHGNLELAGPVARRRASYH